LVVGDYLFSLELNLSYEGFLVTKRISSDDMAAVFEFSHLQEYFQDLVFVILHSTQPRTSPSYGSVELCTQIVSGEMIDANVTNFLAFVSESCSSFLGKSGPC